MLRDLMRMYSFTFTWSSSRVDVIVACENGIDGSLLGGTQGVVLLRRHRCTLHWRETVHLRNAEILPEEERE